MSTVADRLKELGIVLPATAKPVANYVPWVRTGELIFVSGQLPFTSPGTLLHPGKLGGSISLEQGAEAARICALNILAQLNDAVGGHLERVLRIVKLTGFVNCTPDFADHPKVVNGASDFMVQVFADKGRHSRSSVGVSALPMGACVEVEAIAEVV
jgi:enamine deaminase RidA (YjgF/YER057c/UK114 family)